MKNCPDTGTWRAWLDEEAAIPGPEEHLATCAGCAAVVAELRFDAEFARRKMAVLAPSAGERPGAERMPPSPSVIPGRRWGAAAAGVAAALVMAFVLVTPGGRAVAESVLSVFRTQRVDLVAVTASELMQTVAVAERLGSIDGDFQAPVPAGSPEEATAESGIELPAGLAADTYMVLPAGTLRWSFDQEAVEDYLTETGSVASMPDGIGSTTLVLSRGPAVVAIDGSPEAPTLVFARSGPVEGHTEGPASLDAVRSFLLELPGLPAGMVGQLEAIEDWRSTLPLPVPVDQARGSEVELGSTEAVRVEVPQVGVGYLWVDDQGYVTGVAGSDDAAVYELALEAAGQ